MTFLLDTNAVSEPGRKSPDPEFMSWWPDVASDEIFISVLTLGEIRRGVASLPETDERRQRLERFSTNFRLRFGGQLLAIDERVAETWGELGARLKAEGRSVGAVDELIAATALAHDLTVVTRNRRHFEGSGCRLLSPWSGD